MQTGYLAFIDEAGDDGLRQIKSDGTRGASEWLVMSALLVRADKASEVPNWGWDIINKIDQHQLSHLHYLRLNQNKRLIACEALADLPVRIFVLLSNKKNMQGYRNTRAEKAKINRTAWFYCWVSKLLMERVTKYCARRTLKDYGEIRSLNVIFSDRGGVNLNDISSYYSYIKWQSENERLFRPEFDLNWSVIDTNNFEIHPNKMKIGLQLADIAASSFFNGLELNAMQATNPEPAKRLLPRMALAETGRTFGFGVKLMPVWKIDKLHPQQKLLLDFYKEK
ncbi:MAG: DUF3800 domain-containing protein [Phyllobacteriaceae bacterium]|nr:DUF3800 domain-containing protein [Phyllobacteriaceae bacterium]